MNRVLRNKNCPGCYFQKRCFQKGSGTLPTIIDVMSNMACLENCNITHFSLLQNVINVTY